MKNRAAVMVLGEMILATSLAFGYQSPSPVDGAWVGEFRTENGQVAITVNFWTENDVLRGRIDIPREGVSNSPLSWIMLETNNLHFELVRDSGTLVFDGTLSRGKISGDFINPKTPGSFELVRQSIVHK